jgi:hypothetical protein
VNGRYAKSTQLSHADASGARVAYLAPRILPQGSTVASGTVTAVLSSEVHRLDLVAYRTLLNAELGWQIADANDAMNPFDLCAATGRRLNVPAGSL